jgi:hypothetical protein
VIPPGPDVRMPGVAPGAAAQALPLLRNGGVPQWAVETGWRPHQPVWLKGLLLRSGLTVSKTTRAGAGRDGHRPSPAVTRSVLDGGQHDAGLRSGEIQWIRRGF